MLVRGLSVSTKSCGELSFFPTLRYPFTSHVQKIGFLTQWRLLRRELLEKIQKLRESVVELAGRRAICQSQQRARHRYPKYVESNLHERTAARLGFRTAPVIASLHPQE